MIKMKLTDNQTAFEFALYMIAASYFNKVRCKSIVNATKMFMQYREQKLQNQYQMEDICIRFMDWLYDRLPSDLFNQNMIAHIIRRPEENLAELMFINKLYIISFKCVYAGKDSRIFFKSWSRLEDKEIELKGEE